MAEELLKRLDASESLIKFTEYTFSRYRATKLHRMIAEQLERVERGEIDRLMLLVPPRHGKLIAHDTPVLTTEKWKTHGDLRVGDFVFTPSGNCTPVIALSRDWVADFDVTLSTGECITVNGQHEWSVLDRRGGPTARFKTLETEALAVETWLGPRGIRGSRARWQLPDTRGLEFPECELPCDPYVLGAWLGDGSTGKPVFTGAKADLELIVSGVVEAGYQPSKRWDHSTTGVVTQSFGWSGLAASLGNSGCYDDKHIPEKFLRASVEQRLALLAGLIDTDGHVEAHTGRVRIVTTRSALRDGIVDLCSTLGFRPYVTSQKPILTSSGVQGRETVYTVGFQPTMGIPCRLDRKKTRVIAKRRRVSIVSIKPAAKPRAGRCIHVAASDGLYLIGKSLQPTHNSELASRRFPAFYLGRHPVQQLASVSASADLATDFGRDVRNLIQSPEYQALFDLRLAEDSQAKNKWHTDQGGVYYSLGVGGQFMGRGADILMIDDPFANMAEAQSEVSRKVVWDWFNGTAYNRLQPGGRIVVINHRMHEDDLSGRLLEQQAAGGDRWTVVELPAINEDGEALWPDAYPIEALHRIRRNTFPRFWSALYQQRPAPEEGDYFKREWIQTYRRLPPRDEMRVYGGSDYAVTSDGGDYTVHAVVGLDPEGQMYLLDLWRKQSAADEWVEAFCDLVLKWKPLGWAEESGQIRSGVGPFLLRRQKERKAYVSRERFGTKHDKSVRAQSIRGRMAIEGLHVPENADWLPEFMSEMLTFPAGKHDDQVDAMGLVGQLLDRMIKGRREEKPKDEPLQGIESLSLNRLWKEREEEANAQW